MLQTELEGAKNLNDTLEKENSKCSKKLKKLTSCIDKANIRIDSLESQVKETQEQFAEAEQNLKAIKIVLSIMMRNLIFYHISRIRIL